MIRAIIIDDEVHCVDTLSMQLADYCPEVEVVERCHSAKKGLDAIDRLKPDLVFLDIEMPVMNGFELLEQFKQIPFSVIFTTSYDQYAIKAIRFSALDYLLKPIDAKELIAAVHKVQLHKAPPTTEQFNLLLQQIQNKESDLTRIADMLDKNLHHKTSALPSSHHRRLAAILFTDIVGYTAAMQQDEVNAVEMIKRHVNALDKSIAAHGGEILNDYGDGTLCIFSSSAEALQSAVEIQKQLQVEPAVPLRIGLHIGEVFFENGKIMGDGVNLASRIQSLGLANTILYSEEFQDKVKNNPKFRSQDLGFFDFKHVEKPIRVFALANEGLVVPKEKTSKAS